MKNTIKLTNEQINAKSFPQTSIASIISDLKWEIGFCNDTIAEAKANQEKYPERSYTWTIESNTRQMESAKKALSSIELCYRHLSKAEKETPLVSFSLTPNMFVRMNQFVKEAFIEDHR